MDLHGRPRDVTWTRLSQTALVNATSLRLEQAVDWVTGDKIVIAPTGKDGNETEVSEKLNDSYLLVTKSALKFSVRIN